MSPEEKELFQEFSKAVEAIETAVYEKNMAPLVLKNREKNEELFLKCRDIEHSLSSVNGKLLFLQVCIVLIILLNIITLVFILK